MLIYHHTVILVYVFDNGCASQQDRPINLWLNYGEKINK